MPAPLELSGQRFGKLTVVERAGRVKFGRMQAAWRCRCDCGTEVTLPQGRLPHRPTIPASHAVTACDGCRARPCAVCGAPVLPSATQSACCSPACRAEHRRAYDRDWWRRTAEADPETARAKRAERTARRHADPAIADRLRRQEREAHRRKAARMEARPTPKLSEPVGGQATRRGPRRCRRGGGHGSTP